MEALLALLLLGGLAAAGMGGGDDDTESEPVDSGGASEEPLTGTAEADLLMGGDGGDTLDGAGDGDVLLGGAGGDSLYGGDGFDLLMGGADDDYLDAGADADFLFGGEGADTLLGGAGGDLLFGASIFNEDLIEVAAIEAASNPDAPLDLNLPISFDDTADGDLLNGGADSDLILLGGNDVAYGGSGSDAFLLGEWISSGTPASIEDYEDGTDAILFAYANESAEPTVEITQSGADAEIVVNGQVVATVKDAAGVLTSDSIILTQEDGDGALPLV